MIFKILSKFYNFVVKLRNDRFDNGKANITKTKAKVISIGNIIAGGTGKTPVTIHLANKFKNNNQKLAIVGRGYGRKSKGTILIDNKNINSIDAEQTGDEMLLIAYKTKLPVILNEKKYKAAKHIDDLLDLDLIIIDDSFQHRYIHRDIDILLINKATLDKPYTFPMGYLREPIENYKRADFILLEKGIDKSILDFPQNKIFFYEKKINKVKIISNENEYYLTKYNIKTLLISSIANPINFLNFAICLGADVIKSTFFKDHYNYTQEDISVIIKDCKKFNVFNIITTEKDIVKLNKFKNQLFENNINILILEIEINIENEEKFFENINTILNFN